MIIIALIILALPFVFGISTLAIGKSGNKMYSIISPGIYGICFILSLILFFNYTQTENVTLNSGLLNLGFAFTITRLSSILLLLFSFISFCTSLFYRDDTSTGKNSCEIYLAFSAFSIFGLALSGNLIMLFIFSVIIGVITYIKLAGENKKLTLIKSIVLNTISDLAFLAGILMIFSVTKSFSIEEINKIMSTWMDPGLLFKSARVCLLIGVLAKSAVFPFHWWFTTSEKISDKTENIILTILVPSGIILAIKLAPFFPNHFKAVILSIGVFSVIYGLIIAGFKNNLREVIKSLTLSQNGLIFIAIAGMVDMHVAVLLLVITTISRLALLFSYRLIDKRIGKKQNKLNYWIFFISIAMFCGLPFSAQYLGYGWLINDIGTFYYDLGNLEGPLTISVTAICITMFFLTSYYVFGYLFKIKTNSIEPLIKNISVGSILKYLGIGLLLLSSIFFIYSTDPFNIWGGSLLKKLFEKFYELPGDAFASYTGTDPIYLLLITVFVSLGIMISFLQSQRKSTAVTKKTTGNIFIESMVDNQFAKLLEGESEVKTESAPISLSSVIYKFFKIEELSTYIALSLLFIVIFYFIFRTM